MIITILILLTLWLMICAVCGFIGFFIGVKKIPESKPKPPPEPLTEEQERQVKRLAREIDNFYRYDGTKQDDFNA